MQLTLTLIKMNVPGLNFRNIAVVSTECIKSYLKILRKDLNATGPRITFFEII